jgi:hypothetical protein
MATVKAEHPSVPAEEAKKAAPQPKADNAPKPKDRAEAEKALHEEVERVERLKRAEDSAKLEIRPKTHPGLDEDKSGYSVEAEIREQWPLS